jgi:hypothetical protein
MKMLRNRSIEEKANPTRARMLPGMRAVSGVRNNGTIGSKTVGWAEMEKRDFTSARGDQRSTERYPRYGSVRAKLTGTRQAAAANQPTVEEADSTWAPQQVSLAKRPYVEHATVALRTAEIAGGSIVLALNLAKAKPVSIGGRKRNYL